MIVLLKPLPSALVLVLLADVLCFAGALSRFEFSETHMGTQFRIVLYAEDQATAQRAAQAAFKEVARLDAIMSDYHQASELNRLCHAGAGRRVKISADLLRVLQISQSLARRSAGAFDVTVGALTRLWRRARRSGELPVPEKISQALAVTGYRMLHLDARRQTAWLDRDGVLLDLGGIAKGYAADKALRILQRRGIHRALVAAGGDIVAGKAPPAVSKAPRGWTVQIATAAPDESDTEPLYLENAAVSTSGDAEQVVEINGTRYSHIVDPHTGIGLMGRRSVTVVARRGVDADTLATTLSVMGRRGLPLVESRRMKMGAAALLVIEEDGNFTRIESQRWKALRKRSKVIAQ